MLNRRRLLGAVLSSLASVPFWGMGGVEEDIQRGEDLPPMLPMVWSKHEAKLTDDPYFQGVPLEYTENLERWGTTPYNWPT